MLKKLPRANPEPVGLLDSAVACGRGGHQRRWAGRLNATQLQGLLLLGHTLGTDPNLPPHFSFILAVSGVPDMID